jgi:hypothetical protein
MKEEVRGGGRRGGEVGLNRHKPLPLAKVSLI